MSALVAQRQRGCDAHCRQRVAQRRTERDRRGHRQRCTANWASMASEPRLKAGAALSSSGMLALALAFAAGALQRRSGWPR
jgi:hypothetical protein